MPFPTVHYPRYVQLGVGIGSLLVLFYLYRLSTPTTTTPLPPASASELSGISSHSSSPPWLDLDITTIASKPSKSTYSTNTATSVPRNSSSRTSTSSIPPTSKSGSGGKPTWLKPWTKSTGKETTTKPAISRIQNSSSRILSTDTSTRPMFLPWESLPPPFDVIDRLI